MQSQSRRFIVVQCSSEFDYRNKTGLVRASARSISTQVVELDVYM
jgi:hypothetical protein